MLLEGLGYRYLAGGVVLGQNQRLWVNDLPTIIIDNELLLIRTLEVVDGHSDWLTGCISVDEVDGAELVSVTKKSSPMSARVKLVLTSFLLMPVN